MSLFVPSLMGRELSFVDTVSLGYFSCRSFCPPVFENKAVLFSSMDENVERNGLFIICVLWKIFSFIVSITYVTCTKILESDCVYAIIYLWPYDQLFHYEDLLFFSSRKYEEQVAFVWSVRVEFLIFKVWDSCFRASLWPYALYIRRWLLGRYVFQEHE